MPKQQYYNEGYRAGFSDGYASAKQGRFTGSLPPEWDLEQHTIYPKMKSKRKPTAYQKRYGAAYKKLKKQHPRMSFGSLSKKAHRKART